LDEIKRKEKAIQAERSGVLAAGSALDGMPFGQPALALAAQLQRPFSLAFAGTLVSVIAGSPQPGKGCAQVLPTGHAQKPVPRVSSTLTSR
jgi:hypothetical protein